MTETRNDVLDFLLTRRSRPAKMLQAPGPDRAELETLLTAAVRVPDHRKLEPWRLIVLGPHARAALKEQVVAFAAQSDIPEDRVVKATTQFDSPCVVAVISSPKEDALVPEFEQVLSAGCVCLSLVNAALAAGWGASWLSSWLALDRGFAEPAFGLAPHERVCGLIHIGTSDRTPPERPRPDLSEITQWRD